MKLNDDGKLTDQIIDILAAECRHEEFVEIAKALLNLAINNIYLKDWDRARILGDICWRYGFDPPYSVKRHLL